MRTVSKILLVAFLLVAASLFFWSIVRAQSILARDDNPRLVEAEQRIQRGTIFDRNGEVLAQNIGAEDSQQRVYPVPSIGPAVGYYSLTYGTTGAESAFDAVLRGEGANPLSGYWQRVLHLPQIGEDIQLALDARLQETAHSMLGERDGAVLLLELPKDAADQAWMRVLASSPGYDPNLIDEQFEALGANERAPLLNRITQGQYQPGLLLQPLILAAALEQGIIQISDPVVDPQRPVQVNGKTLSCASPPPNQSTWADVLRHQCPGPMQDLADQLGIGGLDAIFAAFELDRDPDLEIDTTTTPYEPLTNPLLAGIGQENLSVTPLKIGLAMAAITGEGSVPEPILAEDLVKGVDNGQLNDRDKGQNELLSPGTRQNIWQALAQKDNTHGFGTSVISGPQDSTNAWYVGLKSTETADQVVVVVLEGSDAESEASLIGRGVLAASE